MLSVTVGWNQAKAGSVDKHACGQACQIRNAEPRIIIIKEKNITKAKFSARTLYFTYKY